MDNDRGKLKWSVRKSIGALSTGNHSYLAITLRVMVVGISKSFLTLYINVKFLQLTFMQIRLSGVF